MFHEMAMLGPKKEKEPFSNAKSSCFVLQMLRMEKSHGRPALCGAHAVECPASRHGSLWHPQLGALALRGWPAPEVRAAGPAWWPASASGGRRSSARELRERLALASFAVEISRR